MESCPTQAVLPLVGLAADNVIRDRYNSASRVGSSSLRTSNFRCTAPRSEFIGSAALFFMVWRFRSPVECGGFVPWALLTAGIAARVSPPDSGFRSQADSRTWTPALPG
ncbi:MAG: hypothetical protein ACQESR_16230 [Planctomycetota bacterium]